MAEDSRSAQEKKADLTTYMNERLRFYTNNPSDDIDGVKSEAVARWKFYLASEDADELNGKRLELLQTRTPGLGPDFREEANIGPPPKRTKNAATFQDKGKG
ncbi:hypothetical protein WJX72_004754 [[Myrmecia] bisecta]|uniref:Uncharacterized protein n=1 Tax=[Myrmecia] bisecta TaxID=41462 RepID=A0AAW1PKZ1_9CHLO